MGRERTLQASASDDVVPGEDFPAARPVSSPSFANATWLLVIYTLAAVAWGVFVRASFSGDGCGSHWPLCDGRIIPEFAQFQQVAEYSHRISTGLILPFVLGLLFWAFRAFPKGHLVRRATGVAVGFTVLEALIGAGLVKFGLVDRNDSAFRAGVMAFHVVSTFLLLGAMLTAGLAASGARPLRPKGQSAIIALVGLAFLGIVLLGISGSVSALGHTLKPVDDVLAAARNPATHWMVRLQPLHPLLAVAVGLILTLVAGLVAHLRPDPKVTRAAYWVVGLYAGQMALGLLNIWLKAPIPMQMAHLVMADLNFLSLVAISMFALGEGVPRVEMVGVASDAPALRGRELVKAYVALTKPRVISLLLFTTLTAMIAAEGGWPGFGIFLAVTLGGYMSAGAANAINMVLERDLDQSMARTSKRPTVTQSISSRHVLIFALTLAMGSFVLLWSLATLLAAVLALSGLAFYVLVYTMLLKRRTPHNIVIGGAAGAFPPLVGWAAVTNTLPPLALLLFAIVFVWTPVHFWALALMIRDDYANAGVPMLPVVKGERATVVQIALYTVATVAVTIGAFLLPGVGWLYLGTVCVLNVLLVVRCLGLWRQMDRPHALSLYKYSMLYLALLFLVLAVDRTVIG